MSQSTSENQGVDVPVVNTPTGGGSAADNAPVAGTDTEQQANIVEVADEEVPLAVEEDIDEEDDIAANTENDNEEVKVEEEDVPLANQNLKDDKKNLWWWALVPIVAAIGGKTAYDKKHKKNLFAEKTSKDNEQDNN